MQQLAQIAANNPDARAGVQRAVVEHILRHEVSNVAAGNPRTKLLRSDSYQTFMRKAPGALHAGRSTVTQETARR